MLELDKKSKIKTIDMKEFWLRLWRLIEPSHNAIIYVAVLIMVFESSKFITPYLLKRVIDLISNFKHEKLSQLMFLTALMFITEMFESLVDYYTDKKIFRIVSDIERYLSVNAHKKMVYLGLGYHEKENTGNKISKIQRGIDKVIDLLSSVFWDVGPTVVQIVFTAAVLFIVDWRFGGLFSIFTPIFILVTLKLNKTITPFRIYRHDKYEEAAGKMAQSIININTVKSFVQEDREIREYGKIKEAIQKSHLQEFFTLVKFNYGRGFIITSGRILMIFLGVYLVWIGNITVGSLVFIVTISEKAFISLFRISRLYDKIMDSSEAIIRLDYLDREKLDITNAVNGLKPADITGQIEFKNVSYIYPGSRIKALDKVNIKINSGCVTALVGPSGGGKTTIARMIYRHYDPNLGQILLDDHDIKSYDLYYLRKFIAIVPQEVEIFNTSVKENIAYADPKASRREITAAAKTANAEEFINKLSQGYQTLVGERGIKLSGGQRQRIGIARAVLANPKIIIFDEATSNLDSYSEKLIQEALSKISKGRTVIIIAHRLSTIKRADKIIVLEDGRVVEEGSHFELAKVNGGLYAKLLSLQVMGEVE